MNFADMWNTPGYFYAIGYTLSMALLLWQERTPGGKRRKAATCAAEGAFQGLLLYLTKGSEGAVFVLSMLAVAGGMGLGFYLNTHDAARSAFLAVKAFIFGEFISSLTWQICYSLAVRFPALQGPAWYGAIMTGVFLGTLALVWIGERHLHRDGVEADISWREVGQELLIALGVYVVSNLGYAAPGSLFSGSHARDIFAIRTLVDFSGVVMLFSFQMQLIEVQRRLEQDALRGIRDLQYQAYQISQESIDLVNRKYHDLKHQIALLRAQAGSGKAEEYLDRMEEEISAFSAGNRTGSPVLDAILTNKSHYCRTRGIEFKYIADGRPLNMLEDMETAALFGNMLDNAIESAERVPAAQKRLIRLYVAEEKGFLRIVSANTCADRLRFSDGLPVTVKQDKRYHGFGMKSMRGTVEKYGGSLVTGQREDWFELKILIPLPPEK